MAWGYVELWLCSLKLASLHRANAAHRGEEPPACCTAVLPASLLLSVPISFRVCAGLCASSCPVSLLFDCLVLFHPNVSSYDDKNGNKMLKTGSLLAGCSESSHLNGWPLCKMQITEIIHKLIRLSPCKKQVSKSRAQQQAYIYFQLSLTKKKTLGNC